MAGGGVCRSGGRHRVFRGAQSEAEMAALHARISVPTMLAQVERADRTLITPKQAEAIGYKLALFGLTLLNANIRAMRDVLALMAAGDHPGPDKLVPFDELYDTVGFNDYYAEEGKYAVPSDAAAE